MARDTDITITRLTERKRQKEIRILWLGEFGHLLMNTLPRINKIRLENPDAYITVTSYEDDVIYFRDKDGNWTIDEYWGIPWWPTDRGCHECKGTWTQEALDVQRWVHDSNPLTTDKILDTTQMTLAEWTAEFKQKPRIAYAFKHIWQKLEKPIDTQRHCVIYARAKNYDSTLFRSWHPDRWVKFVELLLKEYPGKIYVCGVAEESVQFPWSDRVINFTNMKGVERSTKTINILSNAEFCISDCSGSANFAMQVGCPTFVSGPSGYKEGFEKNKNYFKVHVMYQTIHRDALTPEIRMEGFKQFLYGWHTGALSTYEGVVA